MHNLVLFIHFFEFIIMKQTLNVNNFFKLKRKEDINDIYNIEINCKKCRQNTEFFTYKCVECILKKIYENKNKKNLSISILIDNKRFSVNNIDIILESIDIIKLTMKFYNKFLEYRQKKCPYSYFQCKIKSFQKLFELKQNNHDPLIIFNIINKIHNELKNQEYLDSLCSKCALKLSKYIEKSSTMIKNFKLFSKYEKFMSINIKKKNEENFYYYLFFKNQFLLNQQEVLLHEKQIKKKDLIDTYFIGPNNCFEIKIFKCVNDPEKFYTVNLRPEYHENKDYIKNLINKTSKNLKLLDFGEILKIEKLIRFYTNQARLYLKSKFNLSNIDVERIAFLATLERIKLSKLFPFLIDNKIEEIFIDGPNDNVYLNHQEYGRCKTQIFFNQTEVERLKTFLRIYSGKRLDFNNPSIKLVLNNDFFYCRFSADVAPIQSTGFSLDIRKLNKNILTIQDLLKNNTLNSQICSFLFFNIIKRKNITVTGETDTGKTTLINALDLLTPKQFRKIYVEDVIESFHQTNYEKHQLKFIVDPSENNKINRITKEDQIKKLLHRTPDLIYLGEILTKEEAKAMFHCLAAGLRGFQTIHARDFISLINRFLYHFKISKMCLSDLDLLILMNKTSKNERRIHKISEIILDDTLKNYYIQDIFRYNPEIKDWELKKELYETKVIKNISQYEYLPRNLFYSYMEIYNDLFETLKIIEKIPIKSLILLFHEVSYFSHSIDKLKKILNSWKTRVV